MRLHRSFKVWVGAALAGISVVLSPALLAAAKPRTLRVCADPKNLPYSNDRRQGFENQIAALVARELHAELSYTWWAARRGVVRNALNAGECDVLIGVPANYELTRTTAPYYRSTFAFVSRLDRKLGDLHSIDDTRLRTLKIAVPLAGDDGSNPAPVHALARRGITSGLVGFSLWAQDDGVLPAPVQAVADRSVDVALLWGPVAGAAAKQSAVKLSVVPLSEAKDGDLPFTFSIAMGVRHSDIELGRELDAIIARKRTALERILRAAGVPLLDSSTVNAEAQHAKP